MLKLLPARKQFILPFGVISEIISRADVKSILNLRLVFKEYYDKGYLSIWRLLFEKIFPYFKLNTNEPQIDYKKQFIARYIQFKDAAKEFEAQSIVPHILKSLDPSEMDFFLETTKNSENEKPFQNALLYFSFPNAREFICNNTEMSTGKKIINDLLRLAVIVGHIDLVADILNNSFVLVERNTLDKCWMMIAKYGHCELFDMMSSFNIAMLHYNYMQSTCIKLAVKYRQIDIIKKFNLQNFPIFATNNLGEAFLIAVRKNYAEVVHYLLSSNKIPKSDIELALDIAAQYGYLSVVEKILDKRLNNKTVCVLYRINAISIAAKNGHWNIMEAIINSIKLHHKHKDAFNKVIIDSYNLSLEKDFFEITSTLTARYPQIVTVYAPKSNSLLVNYKCASESNPNSKLEKIVTENPLKLTSDIASSCDSPVQLGLEFIREAKIAGPQSSLRTSK